MQRVAVPVIARCRSPQYRIVEEQQTERDRQQIEEAIVSGRGDRELEKDQKSRCDVTQSPWRPDKKRYDDFDDETEPDREFLKPLRVLISPPADQHAEW